MKASECYCEKEYFKRNHCFMINTRRCLQGCFYHYINTTVQDETLKIVMKKITVNILMLLVKSIYFKYFFLDSLAINPKCPFSIVHTMVTGTIPFAQHWLTKHDTWSQR